MTTNELRLNQEIILATKRQHLQERKAKTPVEAVIAMATMQRRPRNILNVSIDPTARVQVIGQITRTHTYDPVAAALRMVRAGVDAVSFFTDHAMYQHDLDDLLMVAMGVKNTPVIYQNYIVNEYNVIEARASDASALVLYASVLDPKTLRQVVSVTQRWKMSAIVQVNDEDEFTYAASLFPHTIGIGHSESKNIERSLEKLERMRPLTPYNTRLMLMGCLTTLEEVETAVDLGVDAIIINENLLSTPDRIDRLNTLIHRD